MDNKEIVVKGEKLKKLVGWLEKRSLPVQAFILASLFFAAIVLFLEFSFFIFTIFGASGLFFLILFILVYVLVFRNMI